MNNGLATFICGCGLLIPASIGLLISRIPTIACPFPALTVLPMFYLSSRVAAVMVPPLLFFAWNPGLFRGERKIPKRSHWLLVVSAILTIIWFIMSWKYGLQYQGARYVHEVTAVNIAWIALLGALFFRSWKREVSFRLNLALHWLLFAWLAWYAFPYLGELP